MNNTLQNGFLVLEHLANDAEECSIKELAEHFGLPSSHIHRLLKTLTETGYVEQGANRKYRISLKILNLTHARLEKIKWRSVARPHLINAVGDLNRPVYLSANHHGLSMIVDTQYPERFAGDAGLTLGQIHSVNRSACGKVCAAYASDEELTALWPRCDWRRLTAKSVTDPEVFRSELEDIRRRGHSRMDAEFSPHVGAVAAPVFSADKTFLGAVGATLPDHEADWSPELWDRFAARVKTCADSISFALGYPVE